MTKIRYRSKSRPTTLIGKIFHSIFGLIFAGFGAVFILLATSTFSNKEDISKWPQANAVIKQGKVGYPKGLEEDYRYDLKYEFVYNKKKHIGTKIHSNGSGGDLDDIRFYQSKYPAGAKVKCYVNVKNPAKSVLVASRESKWVMLPFMLIPGIFVLVGIGQVISVWRGGKETISPNASSTSQTTKLEQRLGLALFFSIFATVGTLIFYFLCVKTMVKLNDSESWVKVPCEIINSRVKSHSDSDGTTFSVDILYRYKYKGTNRTCDDYSFNSTSSSGYDGKAAIAHSYPRGKKSQCFVNPVNPEEAVLVREGGTGMLLGAIFGGIFGLVGYGGIIGALFFMGKKKRGTYYSRRTGFHDPIDEYNSQWEIAGEQNIELKPKTSRFAQLAGSIFVCLFWNAITWTIAIVIIASGKLGPLLFISIFIIIGLGFVIAVFKQLLLLSNAKVKIIASSNVVRLGDPLAFYWAIPAKAERISKLSISFVGVEEATYRRGTDTITDKNQFYNELLFETTDYSEMLDGQAIFDIPETFMHSFSSSNNKIIWQLKVHGKIKAWPDIQDDYVIEVLPMERK